ncbi:MAG: ROK family protein [Bacteroidota bacterium]|nr:ROK family protein [Bacteroidota bacterium]
MGNKKIEVTLGVEIGGTTTVFGLVDSSGKCYVEEKIQTRPHESPEFLFDQLFTKFGEIYNQVSDKYDMIGIGIGAPSANYYKGTIENSSNLNWKYVNVVELVKKYWDLPTVITNDANAAALGESKFGNARGMKNFIQITLGTGLGSGIFVDGNIVYGHDGFAGEIGHMTVEKNGRSCGCGRKGCLETYASTSGLVRTVLELLSLYNDDSVLHEIAPNELTSKLIYRAAINGDTIANMAFEATGQKLGEALANVVACFSPEAIILSEGVALAGDLIVRPTKHHMELNLLNLFKSKVDILLSGMPRGDVAILGASALIWHELMLEKDKKKLAMINN